MTIWIYAGSNLSSAQWTGTISTYADGAQLANQIAWYEWKFTAPLGASDTQVVVSFEAIGYSTATITFHCKIPTGIEIESVASAAPWGSGDGAIGMLHEYTIALLPDTVNFYHLGCREKKSASNPYQTTMPGEWDPLPTRDCNYCMTTDLYYLGASSSDDRLLVDTVGVPSVRPDSCIIDHDASPPAPVEYQFSPVFPDEFQDYGGSWVQFEAHEGVLVWKDTMQAQSTLDFSNGGPPMTGELQGPWEW